MTSFGCDLISTATWRGVRVADLLSLAGGLKSEAVSLAVVSADEFSSGLPLDAALDDETLLVYAMNGAPLPPEHGAPLGSLSPGRYGFKSAKWVVRAQPPDRGLCRLVHPARLEPARAGAHHVADRLASQRRPDTGRLQTIAGLPTRRPRDLGRRIQRGWRSDLAVRCRRWRTSPGRDSWVRWQGSFSIGSGQELQLTSRATDGAGLLRSSSSAWPSQTGQPGWPSLTVRGA